MRGSRRLPLEALAPFLVDVPHPGHLPPDSPLLAPAPPIDWRDLFGNEQPVEIEVGFGKGMFLTNQGAARPGVNFLGIEIERKYTLFAASRIARRSLANVKLACTDARWFLKERVAAGSVAAMHVYFPDPWWKTRHRKRKLFTLAFAEQCARVLMDGGDKPVKVGTKYHLTTKSGLKSDWTVLTLVPTEVISYRIDLGVWDGGISTTELEVLAGRTRVTLKTPCVRWIGAWSIVQRATWPLVLMEAKKTCDRFEDAVRTWLATEGTAAS